MTVPDQGVCGRGGAPLSLRSPSPPQSAERGESETAERNPVASREPLGTLVVRLGEIEVTVGATITRQRLEGLSGRLA